MNSILKKRLIIVGAVTAAVGIIGAVVYKLVTANNVEDDFEELIMDEDESLEEIFATEEDTEEYGDESILDEE